MSVRTSTWLARGAGASVLATTGAGFLAAYLSLAMLPGGVLQIADDDDGVQPKSSFPTAPLPAPFEWAQ
jgi:hypothetical protein